jgi:hypothetical protein
MRALLAEVDERHGSAADYLRAHGLAEAELAALAESSSARRAPEVRLA